MTRSRDEKGGSRREAETKKSRVETERAEGKTRQMGERDFRGTDL